MAELEVVYRERPWPLGPIAGPSRTIQRSCWSKYSKNERQKAVGGQTGNGNMAATRYFNSATVILIRLSIHYGVYLQPLRSLYSRMLTLLYAMLTSVGIFTVVTVILGKKFQDDKPRWIVLFCHETSKKRKTVCRVD